MHRGDPFLLAGAFLLTFLAIFVFDIHWSFYSWPFQFKRIFKGPEPYLFLLPAGTLTLFILLKILQVGVEKDISETYGLQK